MEYFTLIRSYSIQTILKTVGAITLICHIPPDALATVYTYDLEGHSLAPFQHPLNHGAPIPGKPWTYHYYNVDFKRGDVVLTYDDRGSQDLLDDIVNISGKVRVCTTTGDAPERCGDPRVGLRPGTFQPWHSDPEFLKDFRFEYTWDFTIENPIVDSSLEYSTTGFNNFAFDMQPLGKSPLTSPYIEKGYTSVDYSIKTGPTGYAFRLHEDGLGEGIYRISAWILLNGGNPDWQYENRLESFKWDQLVNSDFRAYLRSTSPPENEVPEPISALLLGSGILGNLLLRRKNLNS